MSFPRLLVVAVFAAIWGGSGDGSSAQDADLQKQMQLMSKFSNQVFEAFEGNGSPGNYAAVFDVLSRENAIPEGVEEVAATWLSFVGAHRMAQQVWDRQGGEWRELTDPPSKAALQDAVEAITQEAADRRVVMINEAHHVPLHREFTRQLLEPLYDLGFRYLALETLSNEESYEFDGHPFESRGYPTLSGGYYTQEPAFGEMVRVALNLGYGLIPYEVRPTDTEGAPGIERREMAQAKHLVRFLDENPEEKILVHLGYSHLSEVPIGGNAWMAARLKETTGLDPLTVDQTRLYPRSDPEFEPDIYAEILQRFEVKVPSVLLQENGEWWSGGTPEGVHDISVVHPRFHFEHDRPTWLRASPFRRPVSVSGLPTVPKGEWLLVQAFAANESIEQAIPVDQFLLRPENSQPTLYLPDGDHRLRACDAKGKVVWEQVAPSPSASGEK